MKNYYQKPIEQVFKEVHSSEDGLSSQEAKERISLTGENILKDID